MVYINYSRKYTVRKTSHDSYIITHYSLPEKGVPRRTGRPSLSLVTRNYYGTLFQAVISTYHSTSSRYVFTDWVRPLQKQRSSHYRFDSCFFFNRTETRSLRFGQRCLNPYLSLYSIYGKDTRKNSTIPRDPVMVRRK